MESLVNEPSVTLKSAKTKLHETVCEIRILFSRELDSYDLSILAGVIIKNNNNSRLKKLARILVDATKLENELTFAIK